MQLKALALAALAAPAAALIAPAATSSAVSSTRLYGYVPSGMSKEEWAKIQKKEKDAKKGKNFGEGGARGFKSRSFNSFVDALEKGEATHLFAVDPNDVRSGKVALKDVPYMQRGGSWDNSDLAGKKGWMKTGFGMTAFNDGKADTSNVKKWTKEDKKYAGAEKNVGLFSWGSPTGKEGVAERAKKNGISADQQMWRDSGALGKKDIAKMAKRGSQANINAPEKKFFGLF